MRLASLLCLAFLSLFAAPAWAAQHFSCGGADVRIDVVGRASPMWEDRMEAVVTVARDAVATVLRYRQIDFIGGQCVTRNDGAPLVVFQAFCGGSGCRDLDNWGVVDPKTLRVLTVPSDSNREEAQRLTDRSAMPNVDVMSVLAEARKQGIDVPE